MAVRTAVITAAGLGTRFLPITKALPKEMLPLFDRPLIHYIVKEAVEAGIERIILVTNKNKSVIQRYFERAPNLERALESRQSPLLNEIRQIPTMAEIITVRQRFPIGLGHAVLSTKDVIGKEPFVVYLPDDIIQASPSVTQQMLPVFERHGNVVAVESVPQSRISDYGVVAGTPIESGIVHVSTVVEKPPAKLAPSNKGIVGRYVFTPDIFKYLEQISPGAIGEFQLTDAIGMMAARGEMFAYTFKGKRYDCGTPIGLLKASLELSLQIPGVAKDLRPWLESLFNKDRRS